MIIRVYRCGVCLRGSECSQSITSTPLTVCPYRDCGAPALAVVPAWKGVSYLPGGTAGRFRSTKLRREEVIQNRDGTESIYGTYEQMVRGERERAIHPTIAKDNVKRMAPKLIPGTDKARFAEALESRFGT